MLNQQRPDFPFEEFKLFGRRGCFVGTHFEAEQHRNERGKNSYRIESTSYHCVFR